MTHVANNLIRKSIVTAAGFVGLFWSGEIPHDRQTALVSSAHAVIGRPLTPLSYAGVARRTTRRAVGAGAVLSRRRWLSLPCVRRWSMSTGKSPPYAGKVAWS